MTSTIVLGPASVNIKGVRAGDQNLIAITITSNGTAVNLTGQQVKAQARKRASDAAAALEGVIEIVDAPAGKITLRWPGDAVSTLLATSEKWTGVWDLQIGVPAVSAKTVVAGTFEAVMDVTRP